MRLTLKRYGSTPNGTFGELQVNGQTFYTVERPWKDNEKGVSSVPLGHYSLVWMPTTTPVPSLFRGHTWYLNGGTVTCHHEGAHRTRCAFHIANVFDDVDGCVGVGRGLGYLDRKWAVSGSRDALKDLYKLIGGQNHLIDIIAGEMG